MKKFILSFALFFSSLLGAVEVVGTVREFKGMTIESHILYDYIALATADGQRIKLPSWINGGELLKNYATNKLVFDADLETLYCFDMSRSCLTGVFTTVRSVTITPLN